MKKIMFVLALAFSASALTAANVDPQTPASKEKQEPKTEVKQEVPCVYCGSCKGRTYCATGATCGQALELFVWLCEEMGCC